MGCTCGIANPKLRRRTALRGLTRTARRELRELAWFPQASRAVTEERVSAPPHGFALPQVHPIDGTGGRVWADGVAIGLLRIRAQAADPDRLTAREDSGEPRELTELAAAARTRPRSACPAPEPGFAGDRWPHHRRSCSTRRAVYLWRQD